MLSARPHLAAGLLLGLLVFGYLWPVLVGGKILSPIADLYSYVPWRYAAPSDAGRYVNPLLIDLPFVDYPWRFLARDLIRSGTFPAWNPYVLGGIPFYSNPQTGIFSPFSLPLWILPLTYGLGVSAALKLLAGALGAYVLARQLRLGFLPGLLAGIAFAFSSLNIVWLAHETLPGVAVMLPWAIWLVERIFAAGAARSAFGLAAVTAVALGGGHPGMQVHFVFVVALYALARAACGRERRPRALALVVGGLAVGALLMAFMLLPEVRSSHETVGVLARQTGALPGERMPLAALETAILPDRWGRPSSFESVADSAHNPFGLINFGERTFYAGVVALLLASMALATRGGWRRKAPFAVLGLVGLAVPLDAPGLHWLVTHLPVLGSVSAQRLHFAFEFAVAVLAAFGLQALLDAPRQGRRLLVVLAAAAIGAVALATAGAQAGDIGHTLTHFLSGTDYRSNGVLALTSIAWYLLFVAGVGVALGLARLRPRWSAGIAVAVVLLSAADAYRFVNGFQPMGPASKVIVPVSPAIAYLERHRDEGRIVGLRYALPNDWPLVYGIRDVRGYDPPQPTTRMLHLWSVAEPRQQSWQPLALLDLTPQGLRILSVLGARYLVADAGLTPLGSHARQLKVVYSGRDATILANAAAVPRAFVPAVVRVTSDERATVAAIGEARFDSRTTAALEADQRGAATVAAAHGSATIVRERNASVTLRARMDRRGLVVLNDDFVEGWSVRLDGRPARALHVNDVMRGVVVPAGRHEVVWSYRVPGLRLGAALSLLTLMALGGAALTMRARRRDRVRAERR